MLLERFPREDEGAIARRQTALVRRETLARVAEEIGLGEHIVMTRGEEETGGRTNPTLLADCCEAVIAAIYRDGGLEAARGFVHRYWRELVEEMAQPPLDAKTALQEWAQGRGLALPKYRETGREGPDHAPRFTVEAALDGFEPARAEGASKRAAEQAAAQALLDRLDDGD
jgi:ribonuclease-3